MKGIMEESLVAWAWNGVPQPPLLCTGQEEKEMLTGHLITAGLIRLSGRMPEIVCRGGVWQVTAEEPAKPAADLLQRLNALERNLSDFTVSWQRLEYLCGQVMALDHSAGLHSILLSDGDTTVIGRDIGRHNALDKAAGKALMAGMMPGRTVLCSSGRLSLEMFAKAAAAGIPVLATRKQVGSLCVAYAEKMNMAVCRTGNDPLCYSAAWRIHGTGNGA